MQLYATDGCMHSALDKCMIEDDSELVHPVLTLVLVGRTGNGKSATGNSIIGSKKFKSKRSSSGITTASEMNTTVLKESGLMLNVIDTPGLFDSSLSLDYIRKEIVRSIVLASDGIHAVLVVFSACHRFSDEEKAVISSLVDFFGSKIYDYIIVVFTGGDELAEDGISLDKFISDSPDSLKEILSRCGNRCVLFNNKTRNEAEKSSQVQELVSCVTKMLEKTSGKPYTNEMFTGLKKDNLQLLRHVQGLKENGNLTEEERLILIEQIHDKQLKRIVEIFESKFTEMKLKLEQALKEERDARERAERKAKEERKNHEEKINKMEEELKKAKQGSGCAIM